MTSYKFKRHVVARRFPKTGRRKVKPMTTSEPTRTYIATIDTTGVGAIALPVEVEIDSADPSVVRAAIEAAEVAKVEETLRLRRTFGLSDDKKGGAGHE